MLCDERYSNIAHKKQNEMKQENFRELINKKNKKWMLY